MLYAVSGLTGDSLIAGLVSLIITLLATAFVLYIAGKIIVGDKATFGKAIAIAILGAVLGFILNLILPVIGGIVALLAWWYLIKSQFQTGWLAALAIGILAVIVSVIVSVIVLIMFGIGLSFF